jgi:signal transduction histidine kinase
MSTRRAAVIAVIALVAGLASEHFLHSWEQPAWIPIFALTVGWVTIGAGLVASVARPHQVAGPRLVLAGFLWFGVQQPDYPVLDWIGFATDSYSELVLLLIGLSFAARWPERREERVVLLLVSGAFVAQTAVRLVARSPEVFGDGVVDAQAWFPMIAWADIVHCFSMVLAGVFIVRRWFLASNAARRYLGPVLAGGAATAAAGLAHAFYPLGMLGFIPQLPEEPTVALNWAFNVVRILVPIGMLIGILRQRATRAAVAGAMTRLGATSTTLTLQDSLREALGDPGLRVQTWDRSAGGYRDHDGALVVPGSSEPGASVATVDAADGTPLARLVHDPALDDDPGLVAAGVALTRLVVDNARLSEEVTRQLAEVRASRARIVEAGDAERRRIERDLHDGVQQRLVALGLGLRRAATRSTSDPGAGEALERGADEALAVVEDVRELARGIHPAILSEAGLGSALRALADRSPVPVELDLQVDGRGSATAVATAYYVASEALANVAKHAAATTAWLRACDADDTLRVEVEDDGRGGADPAGAGIRGLDDRVSAIGGTFATGERAGGGTVVTAVIPLA